MNDGSQNDQSGESNEGGTQLDPVNEHTGSSVVGDQATFENLEEPMEHAQQQEELWNDNSPRVGKWMLIFGGGVILAIIAAVVLSSFIEMDRGEVVTESEIELGPIDYFEGTPEQWFRQREASLPRQAVELLKAYRSAPNKEAKSKFVRDPEGYLKKEGQWGKVLTPRLDNLRSQYWKVLSNENMACFVLLTHDEEFLPTKIFFVQKGGALKLDWEASVVWSSYTFEGAKAAIAAKEGELDKGILMRCLLRRKNEFYAGPYNDQEHSAYMVSSSDKNHYFWAYVKRGSDLDTKLRAQLNHGSFIVNLKQDIPVTLRLKRGKKGALPVQLEVMELMHPEWVSP